MAAAEQASTNPLFRNFALFQLGLAVMGFIFLQGVDWGMYTQPDILALSLSYAVALAIISWLLLFYCLRNFGPLSSALKPILNKVRETLSPLSKWQIIVIGIMAGVSEELVFRGAMQNYAATIVPGYLAVFAVSVVFALLHAGSLAYFLFAFAMSLIFGFGYLIYQDIVLFIVWHSAYDVIALWMIMYKPESLGIDISDLPPPQ